MYLSILRLWNFRKYGTGADNAPGLEVHFHEGVNVLIVESDSGKTTIVDAIRYALKTQSGEFIQFDDKDFYQDVQGNRMDEFKIECVFDGLNEQDSGLFWEWLSWNDDKTRYIITGDINNFLKEHFLLKGDPRNAQIKLTGGRLSEVTMKGTAGHHTET